MKAVIEKRNKIIKRMGKRIEELEEIVREKNHTMYDMYNNDFEGGWNTEDNELQLRYKARYGIDLEYEGNDL